MIVSVASGKRGTGKTLVATSLDLSLKDTWKVLADCDVDAADLHLLLQPTVREEYEFWSGQVAVIDGEKCTRCGLCQELCRFKAIEDFKIDTVSCEGCGREERCETPPCSAGGECQRH